MCGIMSDHPNSVRRDAAGKISTRQDLLKKGIGVGCGNGPLRFCIRYGEYDPNHESPSLGCMVRTVLCVTSRYSRCKRIHSVEADAPATYIVRAIPLL